MTAPVLTGEPFKVVSEFLPAGDQPKAIEQLSEGIRRGDLATMQQRFAASIKNVVSTDEFGAVAEGNVTEFLKYLPGVTVDLSGGDPLTLPPKVLESLLRRLREIPHIEIIRIGTRVPVFMPMIRSIVSMCLWRQVARASSRSTSFSARP